MEDMSRNKLCMIGLSAAVMLAVAGCAGDRMHKTMAMNETAAASVDTPAADLRSALDQLLGEHVQLASAATGAALSGRGAEFEAAAVALDANSVDIAGAIGSVYGKDAGDAFLPLWRSHINMVVDYTVGAASKDMPKQDKAVGDLMQYTQDFGAFLNSANPNLPQAAVADLVKHHAVTLKQVIDAQAAGDEAEAYRARRTAYQHMATIAEALAAAIATQFPDKFAG